MRIAGKAKKEFPMKNDISEPLAQVNEACEDFFLQIRKIMKQIEQIVPSVPAKVRV